MGIMSSPALRHVRKFGPAFKPDANTVLWLPGQDDAFSSTIRDRSGFGNDGTLTNGVTWERGSKGLWGQRYNGSDDYVDADSTLTQLASTTVGTWMLWTKLDDATPAANMFPMGCGDANVNSLLGMFIDTSGRMNFLARFEGATQWLILTTAAVLSDGKYANLAVIQDGISPIVLVNGVQVAQSFSSEVDKTHWFNDQNALDTCRVGACWYNNLSNTAMTDGNTALPIMETRVMSVAEVLSIVNRQRGLSGV